MLKTLTVWNFALLEHVQVEFGKGLNILTGETGAGKSILIDALGRSWDTGFLRIPSVQAVTGFAWKPFFHWSRKGIFSIFWRNRPLTWMMIP